MAKLTPRQKDVLEFIEQYQKEHGLMPTIREISAGLSLRSHFTIQKHVAALANAGLLVRTKRRSINMPAKTEGDTTTTLPLLGSIAAGQLNEAIEQADQLDLSTLFDPRRHFLLKVKGDSMIEANILDGDLVAIRRQATCHNGQIVAAQHEGSATLKRFFCEKNRVRLEPANQSMKPIYLDNVEILGVLDGVIRLLNPASIPK